MKAAKLYNFHDIRIEDVPVPEVGPGDALVRVRACGICSGDVMPWYIEKKAPLVLGHEPAGEVVETGRGVTSFGKGDRVFVHHHAPCLSCRHCRRGDYVQCETWRRSRIVPGGVSEYILVPSVNLENDTILLPEGMGFEDACLIEPAACVVKGLRRARIRRGDTVLVIGLGVMGMMNMLVARKYGAERVIGADMVRFRIEKGRELGADEVIDVSESGLLGGLREATAGGMADLVIVGPNSAGAMKEGLACVRPGGQVLFFTPAKPGEMLTIDPNHLYFNDINIITSYSCGPNDTADACELIEKGVVSAEKIVTHRFPIERTEEAFRLTAAAGDSLKSLVVFEDRDSNERQQRGLSNGQ
ncbi:MAG: alcohol dehydrogenase catalytic domain-containing protein [Nitrospiraceae bacterium]|nr:alcohol dehydrogenase catalytic domain-containing protein [Nitrospiraceae bacterium]